MARRVSPRRADRVRATRWASRTTRGRAASRGCPDGRRLRSGPARREGTWRSPLGEAAEIRLRAAPEAHRQVVQAADDEGLDVGECARVHQPKVAEAREKPLEADAHLGASETGAGTEVLAVTEG